MKKTITPLTEKQLTEIVDHETKDEDCRSIQTILAHVVRAGYNYVNAIRNDQGEKLDKVKPNPRNTIDEMF